MRSPNREAAIAAAAVATVVAAQLLGGGVVVDFNNVMQSMDELSASSGLSEGALDEEITAFSSLSGSGLAGNIRMLAASIIPAGVIPALTATEAVEALAELRLESVLQGAIAWQVLDAAARCVCWSERVSVCLRRGLR